MNSSPENLVVTLTVEQLQVLIREQVQAVLGDHGSEERLLDAKEASRLLSVSEDWVYLHAKRLPFARKLAPRVLRFSYQGLLKWASSRARPS